MPLPAIGMMFRVAGAFAAVLLLVLAIVMLADRLEVADGPWRLIASAGVLAGVPLFVLRKREAICADLPAAGMQMLLAGVTVGSAMAFIGLQSSAASVLSIVAVFVAASSEELVFRVLLPESFAARVRAGGVARRASVLMGILLAQAAFAAGHSVAGIAANLAIQPIETMRLFVVGIAYSVFRDTLGFWSSAAFHSVVNILLAGASMIYVPRSLASSSRGEWCALVVASCAGLLLHWHRERAMHHCQRAT